jgi:hypothetical protein
VTLTATDAIAWTTRLVSFGALIASLELLANASQLAPGGLYSWRIVGSRPGILRRPLLRSALDRLLDRPWIVAMLGMRAASCVALLVAPTRGTVAAPALTVLLVSTLLLNLRSAYGQDGSDQMTTQVVAVLWIHLFATPENRLSALCLGYVAAQACLSYFASGVAKLAGRPWRDGSAVFLIFNTETYGIAPVARWLEPRPRIGRLLTWSVSLAETAFPLVLGVGHPACWVFLGWGILFHLTNAVVMGLNGFVWAFLATYPAILYWVLEIERWRGAFTAS